MRGVAFRNPTTAWLVLALIAVTGLWAVLARSTVGAVAVIGFAFALWLLAWRPRLWLSDEGATVRNLRTEFIPWRDVVSIGVEGRWGRWLAFHRKDGRIVHVWAVGWGGGGLYTSGARLGYGYVRATELAALNYWGANRGLSD